MKSGADANFFFLNQILKDPFMGAREVAQWLRALTALAENPGLILSTHTVAHNHLQTPVPEECPLILKTLA